MAADALRSGRKAAPGNDRSAHFSAAASYKSLAHDDEWMCGERQRSHKRKSPTEESLKADSGGPSTNGYGLMKKRPALVEGALQTRA